MDFRKFFGLEKNDEKTEKRLGTLFSSVQMILENHSEQESMLITGYAGLLGRVAYADMDISDVEIDKIREILSSKMRLDKKHIDLIIDLIVEHRVQLFSVEEHHYHRLINEICTKDQKIHLLRALFSVAAADDSISSEEDTILRNISKGLLLSHKEHIGVRLKFRQYLDILKD